MSDQPEAIYQPEVEPGQASQEPSTGEEPKFVTRDELIDLLQTEMKPIIQSLTDKQVDGRLKKWEERVKAKGFEVDDQMRQEVKRRLMLNELDSIEAEDASPRGVPPHVDRIVQDVTAKMRGLEEQYGSLEQEDPEFKMVNFNDPNPDRFLFAYEAALSKAASRKASAPEQPSGNPNARTPSPPGSATGNRKEQLLAELTALQNSRDWASQENQARRKQILKELGD